MTSWFTSLASTISIFIVLTAAPVADACAQGTEAPTLWAGEITDETRGRTIPYFVWAPSDGRGEAVPAAGNAVFEPVLARPKGQIAESKYPLFVLFHGTSGNNRAMAWLGSQLASRGAIVIAANHPGSTSLQVTERSMMKTWHQAEDARFLIDMMLSSEQFGPHIDTDNIISIGFSLGGYSALAIAGVRLNINLLQEFCQGPSAEQPTCDLFGDELYGDLTHDRLQEQDLTDSRITAAVSLAPGFVPAFDETSLQDLDLPVLVIAASQDEMLPIGNHARRLAGRFRAGVYVELSNTSHFTFLGVCAAGAMEILILEEIEFICDDPQGTDRAQAHHQIIELITSFLRAQGTVLEN